VPNFQITRDETLDNKPIIFVRKRVKTHLRQSRIPKFFGEGSPDPRSKRRERGGERRLEERRGEGKGMREVGREGWKGMGGWEGLKEREGLERGEKGGEGRGIWTPDVLDRSTPLINITVNNAYMVCIQGRPTPCDDGAISPLIASALWVTTFENLGT
jgi:hypothetical protein